MATDEQKAARVWRISKYGWSTHPALITFAKEEPSMEFLKLDERCMRELEDECGGTCEPSELDIWQCVQCGRELHPCDTHWYAIGEFPVTDIETYCNWHGPNPR